jgi:hypothetical protein
VVAEPNIAEVVTKIFNELSSLDADQRKRALRAVLALLGDDEAVLQTRSSQGQGSNTSDTGNSSGFGQKGAAWIRAKNVSADQLSHFFHVENGKVDLIAAAAPGSTKTQQTINTYLLMGLKALLETGEAKFDDKAAREACQQLGCYDQTNHAAIIKNGKKNYLNGSKDSGWTLTGPGQKAGAELVKGITPA